MKTRPFWIESHSTPRYLRVRARLLAGGVPDILARMMAAGMCGWRPHVSYFTILEPALSSEELDDVEPALSSEELEELADVEPADA